MLGFRASPCKRAARVWIGIVPYRFVRLAGATSPSAALAAALRTSGFVDFDGQLHDWSDYTGRLIDQRAASRERQRRRRAR